MKITCIAVLLLSAALIEASPARTAEKKSLSDGDKLEAKSTDLKIEELGEDKDRTKKSLSDDDKLESKSTDLKIEELGEDRDRTKKSPATFCVEVKPGSSQPKQISCKESQAIAQNVPLTVQTQAISQPIQTLSFLQPYAQVPQAFVAPQPIVQPLQTLQIVQSAPQPCAQSSVVKTEQKPQAKPTVTEEKQTVVPPKPERIEEAPRPLPRPQETFSILPVAAPCHEHAFTYPSSSLVLISEPEATQYASVIQVPSMASCNNPLHGFISPCTCQSSLTMLNEPGIEATTGMMLPLMYYPSSLAKSSFMMPYDSRMASFMQQKKPAAQQRTSTHVHVNVPAAAAASLRPHAHSHDHNHQHIYQKTLIKGSLPANSYPPANLMESAYVPDITINAYPQILRGMVPMQQPEFRSLGNGDARKAADALNVPVALEASNLQQGKKVPREADPSYLSPERIQKIEEEKGKAFLIDGRRNARSNKETESQKSEA